MLWILGIIILLFLGILIWFNISYSPIKSEFTKLINYHRAKTKIQNESFTTEDIAKSPSPVQKYFHYCGYIGKPKMFNMKAYLKDVDFVQASKKLKVEYTLYSFAASPIRFALIDTSMLGIPFQGLDSYQNGIGSMKGQIAKLITLFNEKSEAMNKACLVTYLSECLIMPNCALQDFINWEKIDETHVKATITYYGISASGIFKFDNQGRMLSFTTEDREYNDGNGDIKKVKWSAICDDYRDINGILYPSTLKAIWHLEAGDLVYFDGKDMVVQYNVTN
ncbi:MAG: hypothetical protein Q8936_06155 [Bacillota bacterium]|nr:hypothetical protein [Bacillota bacterium]